jgi:glycosyltransferase involved in cell wall biosynthesis
MGTRKAMKTLLVIPVFNEELKIGPCMAQLLPFLKARATDYWEVVVADNGSTDRTLEVSRELARQNSRVKVAHLNRKVRGGALKEVWQTSSADILSYMDVDLSTDLAAYSPTIEVLVGGQYDLVTGSRLLAGSDTTRCRKREAISRAYNWLVRAVFRTHFSDAQSGFKAINRQAAQRLLPLTEDTGWFFDTELLVLAEKLGYRILDLPVRWVENPDSRVKIFSTAIADIQGILRLRRKLRMGGGDQRTEAGSQRSKLGSRPGID